MVVAGHWKLQCSQDAVARAGYRGVHPLTQRSRPPRDAPCATRELGFCRAHPCPRVLRAPGVSGVAAMPVKATVGAPRQGHHARPQHIKSPPARRDPPCRARLAAAMFSPPAGARPGPFTCPCQRAGRRASARGRKFFEGRRANDSAGQGSTQPGQCSDSCLLFLRALHALAPLEHFAPRGSAVGLARRRIGGACEARAIRRRPGQRFWGKWRRR